MALYLKIYTNVACNIKSKLWSRGNETSWDMVLSLMANNSLLEEVANDTSFSTSFINNTLLSVLNSTGCIQYAYNALQPPNYGEMQNNSAANRTSNNTTGAVCQSSVRPHDMVAESFIGALIIIMILSFFTRRSWRRKHCDGRPGLVIPVNLLDSYENRFAYASAFGATTTRIIALVLFSDYTVVFGDSWNAESHPASVTAILKILAAIFVGVSYYPFFCCISTHHRLLGAIMGAIYSTVWFLTYLIELAECGHQLAIEGILIRLPAVLCHGFLLLWFIVVLVRSFTSKRRGMVVTKNEWKENYKYHYVKKLLRPIPKSAQETVIIDGFKHKIVSRLYKRHSGFKFSTRMVCIFLTAAISLYLVTLLFVFIGRSLRDLAMVHIDDSSKDAALANRFNWPRIRDGVNVTTVCWMLAIAVACIKDVAMMAYMLSLYRRHLVCLQKGDRRFLSININDGKPTSLMVASFKFAGYQVAYILWGFFITVLVLFVILCIAALGFIWPLTWGGARDSPVLVLLLKFWPTLFITLLTIIAQRLLAKFVFLRDFGATLALNNRRLFHIISYFLFFLNIFIGLISCLIRIFYAILLGALFLPRLQKSVLPREWELFDPGYRMYVGYLLLEHTHANPILVTFSHLVLDEVSAKCNFWQGQGAERLKNEDGVRARNKWFLAITLLNNPQLIYLRKREMTIDVNSLAGTKELDVDISRCRPV